MKDIFKKGVDFVRKNPAILYSLVLIFVMTGIVFFNAYFSLHKFQAHMDRTLQDKAVLAEDVFRILAGDIFGNREELQAKIDEIKKEDSEIRDILIMVPGQKREEFEVIAATEREKIGAVTNEIIPVFAWQNESRGSAVVFSDQAGRFLNVTKALNDASGEKAGLLSLSLSLNEDDAFFNNIIKQVYVVAVISVSIVLLLVLNHVRLLRYAIRAAKLEEIDKMKDDFIAMASHELKSPLVAIRGYAELLKDGIGQADDEKTVQQRRYLENIDTSALRLKDLVEDVLEVSRIEQNRLPIGNEQVDLTKIVAEAAEEAGVMASQKKLLLKNKFDQTTLVSGDKKRIKQILINLLSNGIKYTPEGSVEISGKEDDKYVYVTVADTGLGISAEAVKELFTKFYRVKTKDTQRISGTGLGLWISKEIAVKMGGDLSVESIEGVGSHFTLKLKKAQ